MGVDLAGMQLAVQSGGGFADEIVDEHGHVVATMAGWCPTESKALAHAFAGMPRLLKASQRVLEVLAQDTSYNEGPMVTELYAALNAAGQVSR